jgi:hypothetical protein
MAGSYREWLEAYYGVPEVTVREPGCGHHR